MVLQFGMCAGHWIGSEHLQNLRHLSCGGEGEIVANSKLKVANANGMYFCR